MSSKRRDPEAGKFTHARQLNLARRHLDREQKRELIAQQLRETPQISDRQIAESLGVDHKTVASEREELESIGEIPQCDRQTSDGRTYPAERERPSAYRYIDSTPAGRDAVVQSAKEVRAGRTAEVVKRNDDLKRAAGPGRGKKTKKLVPTNGKLFKAATLKAAGISTSAAHRVPQGDGRTAPIDGSLMPITFARSPCRRAAPPAAKSEDDSMPAPNQRHAQRGPFSPGFGARPGNWTTSWRR